MILSILFVIVCPLLIAVVLIQEPKGGGLAGVLGGSGASPFGAKTADVVMWATFILGLLFFAFTLGLGYRLRSTEAATPSIKMPAAAEAPAAPAPTPGAPASGSDGTQPAPSSAPAGAPSTPASQPSTPAGGGSSGQPPQ